MYGQNFWRGRKHVADTLLKSLRTADSAHVTFTPVIVSGGGAAYWVSSNHDHFVPQCNRTLPRTMSVQMDRKHEISYRKTYVL